MPEQKTILIVEDDANIRKMIRTALAMSDYRVIESESAVVGFQLFTSRKPDLVILDLMLPDGNGLEICAKIRGGEGRSTTPVIILTAETDMESRLTGLSAGADQYLNKPIHPLELIQWVKALLRRVEFESGDGTRIVVGDLSLLVESREAYYQAMPLSRLTGKEFELLYFLVKNRPRVMSRQDIISGLWKTVTVDHVVDTHISNLRKKLPTVVSDKIQNVPGKGFRFFEG